MWSKVNSLIISFQLFNLFIFLLYQTLESQYEKGLLVLCKAPRLTGLNTMVVSINITNLVNNYDWDIYLRVKSGLLSLQLQQGT